MAFGRRPCEASATACSLLVPILDDAILLAQHKIASAVAPLMSSLQHVISWLWQGVIIVLALLAAVVHVARAKLG